MRYTEEKEVRSYSWAELLLSVFALVITFCFVFWLIWEITTLWLAQLPWGHTMTGFWGLVATGVSIVLAGGVAVSSFNFVSFLVRRRENKPTNDEIRLCLHN